MPKVCKRCNFKKPVKQFHKDATGKKGRRGTCKTCRLEKTYGLSKEDYQHLYTIQNGKCAICKKSNPECVDHNHKTGEVRGLLCGGCNKGIGFLKDSLEVVHEAYQYLKFPPTYLVEMWRNLDEG